MFLFCNFYYFKGVRNLKIGEILREKQPKEYEELINNKNKIEKQENLSTREIEKLMKNNCYKRVRGGALRQIR